MKVPVPFVVVFLTAWIAIQGWMLANIAELKVEFAAFKAQSHGQEFSRK